MIYVCVWEHLLPRVKLRNEIGLQNVNLAHSIDTINLGQGEVDVLASGGQHQGVAAHEHDISILRNTSFLIAVFLGCSEITLVEPTTNQPLGSKRFSILTKFRGSSSHFHFDNFHSALVWLPRSFSNVQCMYAD